mmetsp:Transcript_27415/g.40873  ORF Transcript_27415/g.40873 Transcript_27415/m.40873 type:complete len:184 (+) Transcript_27415:208-759(+)
MKLQALCFLLFVIGVSAQTRRLSVSKYDEYFDSYSYSYDYDVDLTTNVYIFNENEQYDLYINVIESTDSELAGEYGEKIGYGEYGVFTITDQEFETTIYYDNEDGGNIYQDNLVYITVYAEDQYSLESSVTYISRDGNFEFSYVSAYDAELEADGSTITANANLTISAKLPDDAFSYSYSLEF